MSVCVVFVQPTCSFRRRRSLAMRLGVKLQVRCTMSQKLLCITKHGSLSFTAMALQQTFTTEAPGNAVCPLLAACVVCATIAVQ